MALQMVVGQVEAGHSASGLAAGVWRRIGIDDERRNVQTIGSGDRRQIDQNQ